MSDFELFLTPSKNLSKILVSGGYESFSKEKFSTLVNY
jgi:hypothetical protein